MFKISAELVVYQVGIGRCSARIYLAIPKGETPYLVATKKIKMFVARVDVVYFMFCKETSVFRLMENFVFYTVVVTYSLDFGVI